MVCNISLKLVRGMANAESSTAWTIHLSKINVTLILCILCFVQPLHYPHSPCSQNVAQNELKVYNIANSQCIFYNVAIQRNCKKKQLRKLSLKLALKTAKAYVDTNAVKVQVNLPICHSQIRLISDNSKTLLCVCVYSKQPIINMKTYVSHQKQYRAGIINIFLDCFHN